MSETTDIRDLRDPTDLGYAIIHRGLSGPMPIKNYSDDYFLPDGRAVSHCCFYTMQRYYKDLVSDVERTDDKDASILDLLLDHPLFDIDDLPPGIAARARERTSERTLEDAMAYELGWDGATTAEQRAAERAETHSHKIHGEGDE